MRGYLRAYIKSALASLEKQPGIDDYQEKFLDHRADELREAFWGAIPDWKRWNEDESTLVYLEWFRFAVVLKPEWRPKGLLNHEAEEFWRENIRVVEEVLLKYS